MHSMALYLARRDAYAGLLSAIDEEKDVAWRKVVGRYPNGDSLLAALDAAHKVTREAFNVVDVEEIGPHKEARALIEQLGALRKAETESDQKWVEYKKAREVYVDAARQYLKETLSEG
ncbi:hypothetical protein AB0H73_06130 [Streptomyces olivoreticuli]